MVNYGVWYLSQLGIMSAVLDYSSSYSSSSSSSSSSELQVTGHGSRVTEQVGFQFITGSLATHEGVECAIQTGARVLTSLSRCRCFLPRYTSTQLPVSRIRSPARASALLRLWILPPLSPSPAISFLTHTHTHELHHPLYYQLHDLVLIRPPSPSLLLPPPSLALPRPPPRRL